MSDVIAMACGCQGRFKCNYHQGVDKGREQERARIVARIREEAHKRRLGVRPMQPHYEVVLLLGIADLIESEVTK